MKRIDIIIERKENRLTKAELNKIKGGICLLCKKRYKMWSKLDDKITIESVGDSNLRF